MGALSIDLTTIAAIWMGGVLLLVPLTGLTLRFGVTPFIGALARYRCQRGEGPGARVMLVVGSR